PRSIVAPAEGAIVLVRGSEWTEATAILSRRGLSGTTLRLRPRHTAVATGRTIASVRRGKGSESSTVLCGSGLAGATLRLTGGIAVVAEGPVGTTLGILVRHVASPDTARLTVRNPGTWTTHGSNCVRTATRECSAGRNRPHTVLLHGLS